MTREIENKSQGSENSWSNSRAETAQILFDDVFRELFRRPGSPSQSSGDTQLRQSERRDASDRSSSPPTTARAQWTIVVDLATDDPDHDKTKLQRLEELAKQTAGKPVTIVVQADTDGAKQPRELERYIIRDGQVHKEEKNVVANESYAKNVQNLLEFAGKSYPSDKVGVVLSTHGSGSAGLHGSSLDELRDAINAGLKGTGHDKLDVLNLDACQMAQNGVLNKLSGVTSQLVASQRPVNFFTPKGDAQDVTGALSALLGNPNMSADELAEAFIKQARKEDDTKDPDRKYVNENVVPVDTLSHFDMAKYSEFKKSLDDLGSQLEKALSDPNKRKIIEDIINQTKSTEDSNQVVLPNGGSVTGHRDIKDFAQRLAKAFENSDPTLASAAKDVIKQEDNLVRSHYEHTGFTELQGLNVFLPDRETLDAELLANSVSADRQLCYYTEPRFPMATVQDRERVAEQVRRDIDMVKFAAEGADKKTIAKLEEASSAYKQLKAAMGSEEEFKRALAKIHQLAIEASDSPFFQEQRKQVRQGMRHSVEQQITTGATEGGWHNFQKKLFGIYAESQH